MEQAMVAVGGEVVTAQATAIRTLGRWCSPHQRA